MARYPADGRVKIYAVPTISNISAPTVAQLNAGIDLTSFFPKDGFAPSTNQNSVATASLADTYDTSVPGTEGGPMTLTLKRDNTTDTAWDHFVRDLAEFLVVREGPLASGVWATGNKVQVYPFTSHDPTPNETATNEERTFSVTLEPNAKPDRKSVVV